MLRGTNLENISQQCELARVSPPNRRKQTLLADFLGLGVKGALVLFQFGLTPGFLRGQVVLNIQKQGKKMSVTTRAKAL